MMIASAGSTDRVLTKNDARGIVTAFADAVAAPGLRALVLIPDDTRSGPMPMLFRLLQAELAPRCAAVDYMIALGTHAPMSAAAIDRHLGLDTATRGEVVGRSRILQHAWDDPSALAEVAVLDADEVEAVSGGLLREEVRITINRAALEYDVVVICGPTFPHEVVGFSGGNKYLFPGIAGPEIIGFFHWLGALITNREIIGRRDTPVREVIDRAAARIPVARRALSSVVRGDELYGLYAGEAEAAFRAAAELSARVNIRRLPTAKRRVLSMPAPMYTELWTAAKAMYKLEPIVADGGELVIYAPALREISVTHGREIERVGYHVRDYFVRQADRFTDVSRCVLAHSTHVKGSGTFRDGVERPRISVALATAIPAATCDRIALGYRDPATIDPAAWEESADPESIVIPHAGEVLYRLGTDPA